MRKRKLCGASPKSIGLWAYTGEKVRHRDFPKVPWASHLAHPKMTASQGGSMHRYLVTLTAVLISTLACASGGSTSLTNKWRAPHTDQLPFHRALTTFVSTDLPLRHSMEDRLATRIPGSFAAYRSIPELSLSDRGLAREQLRGKLFDGAVVMRVVDVRDVQSYRPGVTWYTSYPSFYDFWGSSWTVAQAPGYAVTDRVVFVETVIYSLAEDRLLWAGRTTTENPASVTELVDRTVDAVADELRSQHLIR
jgi:hypothetical protein